MKRFRTSLAAKTAAVLLALAVGAGGFWSTVFILYQWDTLWLGSGDYDSNDYYSDLYNRSSQVHELARLLQNQEWNGALPYLDQRRLDMLEEALSPERTNFRFAIRRNDTGTLVYSNLEGAASLDESVHAVEQEELSLTQNGAAREQDYVVWNGKEQYYLLYIALPDAAGTKQLVTPEDAGLAAQYGYTFDGYTWNYDEQMDSRVTTSVLALEYGATDPLTVQDEFWDSYQDYQQYASYLPALAVLALPESLSGSFWSLALWGGLAATAVEYAVHVLYDRLLGVRFWDYSQVRWNLRGRVCLPFSLAWSLLVAAGLPVIQAAIAPALAAVPPTATYAALLVFTADTVVSLQLLRRAGDPAVLSLGNLRAA